MRQGMLGHVLETEELVGAQRRKLAEIAAKYRLSPPDDAALIGTENSEEMPDEEMLRRAAAELAQMDHAVIDGAQKLRLPSLCIIETRLQAQLPQDLLGIRQL
eukprot:SAG31_NODE_8353_length_1467_cov_2.184211_1_plen_103_part_00